MRTLLATLEASIATLILDKGKDTDLSLRAGAMRSSQRRRARPSPSSALKMAVCVRASAWPSSKLSIARIFLFLAPLGFPTFPLEEVPSVFLLYFDNLFD